MAKISQYGALTGAGTATGDLIPIVDVSASLTKNQTIAQLWVALGALNIQSAYTQTYSTAAKTVPLATVLPVVTTGSGLASFGYTQAQADAIPVAINALAADVLALKKVVTALIDDLQALGLVG